MLNNKIVHRLESGILPCSRRGVLRNGTALGLVTMLPSTLAKAAESSSGRVGLLWNDHWPVRPLLHADLSKLLDEKGRHKAVHDRRVLDDMESDAGWIASPAVKLGYITERSRVGTRSLRFSTSLRNEDHIRAARRPNGTFQGDGVLFEGQPFAAYARLHFKEPQDWRGYNRISLWAYLHPTDNPINTISIQFLCDGASAGPLDPVAVHYVGDLKSGEWNHIVWEIPEHQRNRVVEFTIFQTLSGVGVADANPLVTFDFDDLAVERIDAEPPQGWAIVPGTIAFSHVGYQPAGPKMAIAPEGPDQFDLLDANTNRTVATFPAQRVENGRGTYRVLDFTGFAVPGSYRIRHGAAVSEAFPVAEDAWRFTIEATLNAFYGLRCGFPVPGVHGACHQDVFVEFKGEKRSVEGGWHDAANLTQSPYRTHLSIYALLELHDALVRKGDNAIAERALEEARWGLNWSVRTRFSPCMRALYNHVSYWTDSLRGTIDDVIQDDKRSSVGRDDFQNTLSVLAAARAVRTLQKRDRKLAAQLLKSAREDFDLISPAITPPTDALPREINEPSWRDQIGYLTLAAVELFRATRDARYAGEAVRFGRWLVQTQERRFIDGIGIAGYFYEDAGRTRIVHEYHNSFEDCGLLAFAALCDALPDHPEWMDWYAGLAIYADHYCAIGSKASAPFDIIPAAVWRQGDLDAPQPLDRTGMMLAKHPNAVFPTPPAPELIRQQMQQQYDDATPLGGNYRLRVFPLWYDHVRKGATTVHMSKTIGLGVAAAAMQRPDLSDLAARQVQWVLGANPFSRSLIYGVGNAFWQNFTVALPNFVGGMSLGFNSYEGDSPAWGNNAVFPYKEMWVYSNCRMAMNLSLIGIGASVSGTAVQGAEFRNERTSVVTRVRPGRFSVTLACGRYAVRFGSSERPLFLADGTILKLTLDPARSASLALELRSSDGKSRTVEVSVTGNGSHKLETKVWNAKVVEAPDVVQASGTPNIHAVVVEIIDPQSPWYLRCNTESGPESAVAIGGR